MPFSILNIAPTDRVENRLDEFDKAYPYSNSQRDWALDSDENLFIRIRRSGARKDGMDDLAAFQEFDYHLR